MNIYMLFEAVIQPFIPGPVINNNEQDCFFIGSSFILPIYLEL